MGSVLPIFLFFCVVLLCVYVLSPLRFPHKNDARFVFTSSCLYGIHVFLTLCVCVCLRIVVPNTYCVVFLFLFVLCFVYPMLPVSLDYPFLIAPSVYSDVYLTVL